MEPIPMYLGAIAAIIEMLSKPGPRGLRALIVILIISIFSIIFSRYKWVIRFFSETDDTPDPILILVSIAIIYTGLLLYSFPYEGIVVLIGILPILFFWFLWHIGLEELTLLIIGLSILHFFKVSTNTLLMIIIFFVYLYKLLISREYKKLCHTHNNLVNSYNLAIKDRDKAIRERNELKAKQKRFDNLNYSDDYF